MAMKQQTQKQQPETAAKIVGQGTLAGANGGLPFVLVTSSSEPGRVHVVSYSYEGAYVGARMHCDCTWYSYHGPSCRHTRVVGDWLEQGLAALGLPYMTEANTHTPHTPQAPPAPRASSASRATADARERDTAVLRRPNNVPFSILK